MLPSTLDIMWPMHKQSLILLHPEVEEKMYLQENTLNDLDLEVKVTWNVSKCPLHHVTYAPTEFEITTSKALGGEAFTRKLNIWPLTLTLGSKSHKMLPSTLYIMWPIQLQSLKLLLLTLKEEIHLQENTLFDLWPWPLGQGHSKCCPVPSTSCDLFSYRVWSCYIKMFRRRCIYKKIQFLTLTLGSMSHKILPSILYIMWPIQLQSLKLLCLTV